MGYSLEYTYGKQPGSIRNRDSQGVDVMYINGQTAGEKMYYVRRIGGIHNCRYGSSNTVNFILTGKKEALLNCMHVFPIT